MPSLLQRRLGGLATVAVIFAASPARAEEPAPAPPAPVQEPAPAPPAEEPKVDVMHVLEAHGLHDFVNERFNVYGQITLIGHGKAPFKAGYTNLNGGSKSLVPSAEGSWTGSATLYLGARLWHGAEAYVVPELISERPLSGLAGLGGAIQNAELQKSGKPAPTLYLSRIFLRQTIGFGGARVARESGQMQLGTTVDSRRIVLTVGNFSTLDFLDKSSYTSDIRRQFVSLAFMTHAAWDFASDARGYTWGAVLEAYFDDFALRAAHTTVPQNPNDLAIDFRFWKYYGDQIELEHTHHLLGQPGAVRLLGYRNLEKMGRFEDAIAALDANPTRNAAACTGYHYDSTNAAAPDLCWVRRPNTKMGIGVNVEQALGDNLGVFARGMYSDGQTEVYAYMPADESLSFGALARGAWWRRPSDSLGAAVGVSWISKQHADYLGRGGIDGFIGDGKIRPAAESVFEMFYSVHVLPPLWLSFDYQHITNPAYNADRGPVDVFGARLHAEI